MNYNVKLVLLSQLLLLHLTIEKIDNVAETNYYQVFTTSDNYNQNYC